MLAELKGHVAELVVHAEGSGVVQLVYQDVATNAQRQQMYTELWGRECAASTAPLDRRLLLLLLLLLLRRRRHHRIHLLHHLDRHRRLCCRPHPLHQRCSATAA